MDPISQLDVQSPDHISVITRDGKVTISVTKDGSSVTLGFPIRNVFNTTPATPLQQPIPRIVAVKETQGSQSTVNESKRMKAVLHAGNNSRLAKQQWQDRREHRSRFKTKLTEESVREIKQILADPELMSKFSSKSHACEELGRIYGVSACRIMQISNGKGWNHVKV